MSTSVSATYGVTAPLLVGVWVFDPVAPDDTARNFLFADGRAETVEPDAASIKVAGRPNPLLEYGEAEVVSLSLTVMVPFGDDYEAGVQWWRDACKNRRAINYRDNRGRLYWVGLPRGISITDGRMGSAFAVSLQRLNYDEAVA